ncbi:MAG: enoyl-CoA hydratase-related protein [Aquincola tertiaricarbonis]
MNYDTIRLDNDNGILWLTLNRPQMLNAFTLQMADELIDAFGRASDDDAVRVVIVTGEGKGFCAGMDLGKEGDNPFGFAHDKTPTLADMDICHDEPASADGVRDSGGRVALAIMGCRKPVIAAVNGPAVGIGATMLLSMDIRLASDQARFGFIFGRVGIVPEACSSWLLPRIVGVSQALEWFYRADVFDAQVALRGGLLRAVVPAAELRAEAERMARGFMGARSAVSAALTRQLVYTGLGTADRDRVHKLESLGVFYTSQKDGTEGVAAFRERREPKFMSSPSKDMPPFYPW